MKGNKELAQETDYYNTNFPDVNNWARRSDNAPVFLSFSLEKPLFSFLKVFTLKSYQTTGSCKGGTKLRCATSVHE